ncbi:TetR/AcrR family transcriptional regulator [Kutzneria sp. CA-103260]|uniref:TetR/AcrR family transcriptional regulator n=1 Tax=Kutzneria sp. CA-103260 TaxID=2802641 RepID=UPI001BA59D15|nr:TetR/AcrR family transcriptional regulator [Kutzneria sp. CA-103260]QUQ66665.1 TetR family transcriptional regulator [Kutzneria sp. CA-103260]
MPLPEPPWRKPVRQQLSRELIVDTALDILDREGMAALSMRRIATELGTGAASLYAHVSNKEELQELLLERVLSQVPHETPDPARWADQLRELCRQTVGALISHPGIAQVALTTIVPTGEASFDQAEAFLGLLRVSGLSDPQIAVAFDVLSLYGTAYAVEANAMLTGEFSQSEIAERSRQLAEYMASLPAERFPALLALGSHLGSGDGEQRFLAAVDLVIAGMEALAARSEG